MATITQVPASRFGGGGPITFKITVDPTTWTQLRQIEKGLTQTDRLLNDPRTFATAIPVIGNAWALNWGSRGSRVGGWEPKSEYTQRIAEERGFGAGRTLEQSGYFRRAAFGTFQSWTPSTQNYSANIPPTPQQVEYSDDGGYNSMLAGYGGNTGIYAQITNRAFTAAMNGPKAANQEGGSIPFTGGQRGFVNLPARPFWFFDQQMVDDASTFMTTDFLSRWVENMPNPVGAANRAVLGGGNVIRVTDFGY